MPWASDKEMPEHDALLVRALAIRDATICQCCGQWAPDAHDPEQDGWWEVSTTTCYAGAAMARFRKDQPDEPEPGELAYLVLTKPE